MSNPNGSLHAPFNDLRTALQNPLLKAGQTIYLRGGTHRLTDDTVISANDITIQPYPGEAATIDLQSYRLYVNGSGLYFEGLEITSSNLIRETTQTGSNPSDIPLDLIDVYGANVTFAGCTMHDFRQFGAWESADGLRLVGCHLYNIGWHAPDRGHGHQLYGQGGSTERVIDTCIFGQTFGNSINVYGTAPVLRRWTVRNCIFFNQSFVIGGVDDTPLIDEITCENCTFFYQSVDFGWHSVNLGNLTLKDNIYSQVTKRIAAGWQSFSETGAITNPTETTVRVFQYPTTHKVAQIAVMNPTQQTTVMVDVSALALTPGAGYRLRSAHDPIGNVNEFTYDGSDSIEVAFTGRTVAVPLGYSEPRVEIDSRFGAWLLEAV